MSQTMWGVFLIGSIAWASVPVVRFNEDLDLSYLSYDKKILCFSADEDLDNDGYANKDATPHWTLDRGPVGFCPRNFLSFGHDCNDEDPDVHPFGEERPGNGIDDNCDGAIDEIVFDYPEMAPPKTDRIRVRGKLGSPLEIKSVRANVVYQELATYPSQKQFPIELKLNTAKEFDFSVPHLLPGRAYRVQVLTQNETSPWYYGTTSGPSSLEQVRAKIVQLSFHEWDASGRGETGYAGDPDVDGTRYHAHPGEWWCSEYYAWLGGHWVTGLVGASWVGALRNHFRHFQADLPGSTVPSRGKPGDYLAMDSNGQGTLNHSGMLVAVESNDPVILWTIEGNVGNKTKLKRRLWEPKHFRLGSLTPDQI